MRNISHLCFSLEKVNFHGYGFVLELKIDSVTIPVS